jgi:hypothetical protein
MKIRCEKRNSRCSYFTDGKTYEARQMFSGDLPLKTYEVRDDRGNTRVVIPDGSPCPHFYTGEQCGPNMRELLAGRFRPEAA